MKLIHSPPVFISLEKEIDKGFGLEILLLILFFVLATVCSFGK